MENTQLNHKNSTMVASHMSTIVKRVKLGHLLALSSMLLLSACGGGADSESRPDQREAQQTAYTGAAEQSDDIKAFRKELWEKISPASVCGRCHRSDADTRQAPYFADWLDINFAYNEVVDKKKPLANLTNPAASILVQRVKNGHQCWLGSTDECAKTMTSYIQAWADSSKKGETLVEFQVDIPSRQTPPKESYFFPTATPATDYDGLYALVRQYCSGCHNSNAGNAQSPFFADANKDASYRAIKQVINLNEPENSRAYQRLLANHNCWSNCADDANELLTEIKNFTGTLTKESFAGKQGVSYALQMQEGNVASSHNRYESDQIALYEFQSGSKDPSSNIIYDTSGVAPTINLTLLDNNYRWLGNWGIEFSRSRGAIARVEDSRKLYNLIRLSGEYTIEAWVIPANVNQEDATMVAYSGSATERNFALGQTMYNYDFFQRSSTLGADGQPKLMTNNDDEDLQATLQHVVMTYSVQHGRRIYVNGKFTDDTDPEEAGDLLNWHSSYTLSFGNELSNDRAWDGILRMVAIHDRALTEAQIQQNYQAEVGQKFQVPFNVSHLIGDGVPHSYVVFEVSQFDEYSYLFRNPRFINIDPASPGYVPPKLAIQDMRIGVNNQVIKVGQAYTNISIPDVSEAYSAETGKILSTIDTVIPIQNGATGSNADEFFLTFGTFGDEHYVFSELESLDPPTLPTVTGDQVPSDIGVRTFDEINATMASMTGIDNWSGITAITNVYTNYRKQLPAVENLEAFQGSQQMAIAQLAMAYCDHLVENKAASYFAGFVVGDVYSAFTPASMDSIINPLLSNMFNATVFGSDDATNNLTTQPSVVAVHDELTALMTGMVASSTCTTGTQACIDRTRNIMKAACAAALGSAAMLIQ